MGRNSTPMRPIVFVLFSLVAAGQASAGSLYRCVGDDGMPEGLSRVLDIMKSAIAPLAVGEAKPADATVSKQLPAKA